MSDHKNKVRKAAEKVQRRLLGDDNDKAKVMKKSSTPDGRDAALPRDEEHEAPGLIDPIR